jgi:hypothetical protein
MENKNHPTFLFSSSVFLKAQSKFDSKLQIADIFKEMSLASGP